MNHNGGVMVRVISSRVVGCGLEHRSGQTKDYKIGIYCFSAKHSGVRTKIGWLRIRIMCLSGMTFLLADCCFSEVAL